MLSPRMLNILPFIGYTPIIFLSSRERPEIIPDFAESPSHKIKIHSLDLTVPAKLASTSLGILRIVLHFVPSVFLAALFSFTSVRLHARVITPIFANFSINLLETSQLEPKLDTALVK